MLEKIVVRETHEPKPGSSMVRRIGLVHAVENGEEHFVTRLESEFRKWSGEAREQLSGTYGDRAYEVPVVHEDYWLEAVEPPTT